MLQSKNITIFEQPTIQYSRNHKSQSLVDQGYALAEGIIEVNSKSFAFASKFLNKETKKSVVALYAFCRMVDDIVDESDEDPRVTDKILNQLKSIVDELYYRDVTSDPVLLALGDTLRKHQIPKNYVYDLIEGVRMDLYKTKYDNFQELYLYSYRVASTVGLMMTHIFVKNPSKSMLKNAESMGIAMQITNILRDVKEDHDRGRVYIPQDWLQMWGVNQIDLHGAVVNGSFKDLIHYMSAIARKYYRMGFNGVKDLPAGADFVVELSGRIYGGILDEIEKNDYQVLEKRHFVSKLRKLYIASKLRLKFRRSLKAVKVLNNS